MKRLNWTIALLVGIALLAVPAGDTLAQKKIKVYSTNMGFSFTNNEGVPAHGLTVILSGTGNVAVDDTTGTAGPFRNLVGNETSKIVLTNPTAPIPSGGDGSTVDLNFRSYNKKLKIANWWWTDEKGKRIGKKKKG